MDELLMLLNALFMDDELPNKNDRSEPVLQVTHQQPDDLVDHLCGEISKTAHDVLMKNGELDEEAKQYLEQVLPVSVKDNDEATACIDTQKGRLFFSKT